MFVLGLVRVYQPHGCRIGGGDPGRAGAATPRAHRHPGGRTGVFLALGRRGEPDRRLRVLCCAVLCSTSTSRSALNAVWYVRL